ncbi:MAG: hypothetical protein Gyms2KO_28160 [Gymnodinialimonas sp.]
MREDCGFSQEHVSGELGITAASFSRMEAGKSSITTHRLSQLAAIYEVSAGALLEGSIVRLPHRIDLERLKLVITEIENTIARLDVRPSAEKVADAIAEVYQSETEHVFDNPRETFDPSRHRRLIELIFKK